MADERCPILARSSGSTVASAQPVQVLPALRSVGAVAGDLGKREAVDQTIKFRFAGVVAVAPGVRTARSPAQQVVAGLEFGRIDRGLLGPVDSPAFEPGVVGELPAGEGEEAARGDSAGSAFENASPVVEAGQMVQNAEQRDEVAAHRLERTGFEVVDLEPNVGEVGGRCSRPVDQLAAQVDAEVTERPGLPKFGVPLQKQREAAVAASEVDDT